MVLVLHLPVVELILPLPELFIEHPLILVIFLRPLLLLGPRGSGIRLRLTRWKLLMVTWRTLGLILMVFSLVPILRIIILVIIDLI